MSAYAVAHLYDPDPGHPEIGEYLRRIQDTLDPYGGRFIVHGGNVEVAEGKGPGALVVIEFPDRGKVRAWYASGAYQEILPLRTRNIDGDVIFADGVPDGYHPAGAGR
jgi:uncharacterized protein (DUF1330 family)